MRLTVITATIAIMLLVVPVSTQAISITGDSTRVDSILVSGYIAVDANLYPADSTDESKCNMRWARIRFDAYSAQSSKLRITLEYDIANSDLSYAYAMKTWPLFGGELNISGGKVLSVVGDVMPGPNKILFGRWAGAFDDYDIKTVGVTAIYEKSRLALRAMYGEHMQVSATYGFVSAMWQEKTAYGFMVESPLKDFWLEPAFIFSVPEDSTAQYSVRNYTHLTERLSFNQMLELGQDELLTFGFTYEYAQYSFAKAYVDLAEDRHPKYFLEITCTF